MVRRIGSFLLSALALAALSANAQAQSNLTAKSAGPQPVPTAPLETDRNRDGLVGPVRRVRTEVVKLSNDTGKAAEGKRAVLEVVSYDLKGSKVENQYFPIAGANLTGKEVYKYDDKGNISEMTLLNTDGSLLSKEVYKYEFDFAGNWNKMTTSVAVIEGGKMSFEPTEITYRSIMYYLDENMMKMAQPASQPATPPAAQPNTLASAPATNTASANLENKTTAVVPKPSANSNNSNATHKTSPSLPGAMSNAPDKLSGLGSVELTGAKTDSNVEATAVNIESEPPPPAPRPILKPVSGGVLNGIALSLPSPIYPETARRLRTAGVVTVDVVVDETGKVISAVATSGPSLLRDVAVQAALRARFSPTKLSGQPVKVSGLINYKFALTQ
ncbi:MAG TPA: TonB family protein [Pyrinomonadaceae bacterium]|nr:TonB family protein [Pyrinomonadaceae bacterium]